MKQLLTILIFIFALPLSDVFAQHNEPLPNAVLKMDAGYSIKGNKVTAIDKTTMSTKNTSIPSSQAVVSKIKEAIGDSLELLPTYISNLDSTDKSTVYNAILPYKQYVAKLTKASGAIAPTALVLENSLGFIPTFTYNSTGNYTIGGQAFGFRQAKTTVSITNEPTTDNYRIVLTNSNDHSISMSRYAWNYATNAITSTNDDFGFPSYLIIRVYK